MVAHLFLNSSAAQLPDRADLPRISPSPFSKATRNVTSNAASKTVVSRFIRRPGPEPDCLADKTSIRSPTHQTESRSLGVLPQSLLNGRLPFDDESTNNDDTDDTDDTEEYDTDDMLSVTSGQTTSSGATVSIANTSNRSRRSVSVDLDSSISTLTCSSASTVTSVSKSVSFSTVSVRTHEIVHGEHVKPDCPVALGWDIVEDNSTYASIDRYELRCRKQNKEQHGSQKMSPTSAQERRQQLLAVGYSDLQLVLLEGRRQELKKQQEALQEATICV